MRLGSVAEPMDVEDARAERAALYRDGRGGENCPATVAAVGCLMFTFVFTCIFSIDVVVPRTYAIKYNRFTKTAYTDHIYINGRYFIGPWNTFLHFPAGAQTLEFMKEQRMTKTGTRFDSLHTRTKDGLALHLQVSLQYQLQKEHLGQLYSEFNQQYEQVFSSTVRDELIRTAARYEATQLWTERATFSSELQSKVNRALMDMYAECWGLQLMVIDLPQMYEDSIVTTQVQKQRVETRDYEQQALVVRAQTEVLQATFDRQVTVIQADAQANYTTITRRAAALAEQRVVKTEAEVLGIFSRLNLTAEQLVAFQRYTSVGNMEDASVFYGFDDSAKSQTAMLMQTIKETVRPKDEILLSTATTTADPMDATLSEDIFQSDSPDHDRLSEPPEL